MPATRSSRACSFLSFARIPRLARSPVQIALVASFIAWLVVALVFPSIAFATGNPEAQPAAEHSLQLSPIEQALIAPIALLLAFMGLYKDFRSYRGLLHILLWNFYSWLFLAFTTMFIFAIDYAALLQIQKLIHPALMQHVTLALGHTTISAAFAYTAPFILRVIPTQSQVAPAHPAPASPERKPATEMNVIYAAIRESLENQVNGKICEWAYKYSWSVIKSTGRMLLTDLHRSGVISQDEFENARTLESSYKLCLDPSDDRDVKYELLRLMMSRSSYYDLSTRLERTAKAERAGAPL